jgi:hypothetical protein
LMTINYDICNFARVGLSSTYMNFGVICDIFIYHQLPEPQFS